MNQIFECDIELLKQKKVIIFGCFRNASEFAMRLLNQGILFDMFLFPDIEEKYELPSFLNKPIINISKCLELENYIILVSYYDKDCAKEILQKYGLNNKMEIEQISQKIRNSSNIVLYGTGGRAESFIKHFQGELNISCVCDSDIKKAGMIWHDKKVISPDYFSDMPQNSVVIVASTFYDEICEILYKYGIGDESIFITEYGGLIFGKGKKCLKVKTNILSSILRDVKGKYVVVYGKDEKIVEEIICKFKLLNVTISQVKSLDFRDDGNLVKEDCRYIIAQKYSREQNSQLLMNTNLNEKIVIWLERYNSLSKVDRKLEFDAVLDPTMGHAYVNLDEEYVGFMQYQYVESETVPIKIVALGNSTTMGYGMKAESWCECLSNLLKGQGISHIIYNGGVDSYTASHELLKLIRDVIWIHPDVVISYTGTNNMSMPLSIKNPFIGYAQEDIFEQAVQLVKIKTFGKMKQYVNYGVTAPISQFDFFYKQLEMMHAICESSGIYYKAFLQPVLPFKKKYYGLDGNIALFYEWLYDKEKGKYISVKKDDSYLKYAQEFILKASEKKDPWFCNLADLFENVEGVYADACHVYVKGNQLIAEKILEELKDVILNRYDCQKY